MSVGWGWGELGYLFANDTHLFAIVGVERQASHLFLDCRTNSPARGCLPEGCADRFGVGHSAGSDDIKRS